MPPTWDMAPYSSVSERLRACRGWIVTDGRVGTLATASGVAEALGLEFEHKRVAPRAIWSMLPSWSVLDPREDLRKTSSLLSPPWPDIAIAAGARTIPYLQALRRASEGATFTVILQHPRTRADVADLAWCPAHDHLSGANVVTTLTSPHRMRPHELADLRRMPPPEIAELGGPLAAVLLGGPNRDFAFNEEAIGRLGASLRNLAAAGTRFLITPSQRTTATIFRAVTEATRGAKRIVWTSKGANPYWTFLAHSDLTIVTADSVNMTSEACVTGRPVYVFNPDGGSERYKRFHDGLRRYGATRALTLQTDPEDRWTYSPLDAAPRIAAEIACRFSIAREPRLCLPLGLSAARSYT